MPAEGVIYDVRRHRYLALIKFYLCVMECLNIVHLLYTFLVCVRYQALAN